MHPKNGDTETQTPLPKKVEKETNPRLRGKVGGHFFLFRAEVVQEGHYVFLQVL